MNIFFFLYASPNRNSIFIYCILRNLQAEAEFPFLEEEELISSREAEAPNENIVQNHLNVAFLNVF